MFSKSDTRQACFKEPQQQASVESVSSTRHGGPLPPPDMGATSLPVDTLSLDNPPLQDLFCDLFPFLPHQPLDLNPQQHLALPVDGRKALPNPAFFNCLSSTQS